MKRNSKSPEKPRERLNPEKIEEIVALLHGWSGKLTWNGLLQAMQQRWGYAYSRVSLPKHERIKQAFDLCKERSRKPAGAPPSGNIHLQKAQERIQFLEAQNQDLLSQNSRLQEKFVIWAYNATLKGLEEADLEKPMFPINRRNDQKGAPRREMVGAAVANQSKGKAYLNSSPGASDREPTNITRI